MSYFARPLVMLSLGVLTACATEEGLALDAAPSATDSGARSVDDDAGDRADAGGPAGADAGLVMDSGALLGDADVEDAATPDAGTEDSGAADAGPGDAGGGDSGAPVPCDPSMLRGQCDGNVYVQCVSGFEKRTDCSDPAFGPNNVCVSISAGGGCAAAQPGEPCGGAARPACVGSRRLVCASGPGGALRQRYSECPGPNLECIASTLVPGAGRCVQRNRTDPCPEEDEDRSICIGNDRVRCTAGQRLRLPCGAQTCLDNGMGSTMCAFPGPSCDPATFVSSCIDPGMAEVCDSFGQLRNIACPAMTICCADDPMESGPCCSGPP